LPRPPRCGSKEADIFLVERAVPGSPDRSAFLAAKRYRGVDHRLFSRDAAYTQGRRIQKSREARAAARGSTFGREVKAGEWARHELGALS